MNHLKIKRALISVSDKTDIIGFAEHLQNFGVEIISTGGTFKILSSAGVKVKSISEITDFPEILNGRVKTLHPKIHAGLLAMGDNAEHQRQLNKLGINTIDMVVINLYPFEETILKEDVNLEEAIEQIDIGGPSILRAAAKNFMYKAAVSDPIQYSKIVQEMKDNGGEISEATRFNLAKEAFLRTAKYDTTIFNYLNSFYNKQINSLPPIFSFSLLKSVELRYGENPHQQAALYGEFFKSFEKLHGKELSYNNIVDIQAAAELVAEFDEPTIVIVKHNNPCGVGSGKTLTEAYKKAFATDQKSAFGGIVAMNAPLDLETSKLINQIFTEVIVAPYFDDGVLDMLKQKKERRIIKQIRQLKNYNELIIKNIVGGVLVQTPDNLLVGTDDIKVVTKRAPTEYEREAMLFGWKVAKHVKSNAIVYARPDRTIGIGAGQMSRFDSSRIAALKAQEAGLDLRGTAVASDAFFPFSDGLLEAVKAGATAVIQPGGSIRDTEVIKAADDNNIAMVFTGLRHFKH